MCRYQKPVLAKSYCPSEPEESQRKDMKFSEDVVYGAKPLSTSVAKNSNVQGSPLRDSFLPEVCIQQELEALCNDNMQQLL